MSNSQVITQGKAEYKFECYEYNYSLNALKHIQLPTNHTALPMTPALYPCTLPLRDFQLRHSYKSVLLLLFIRSKRLCSIKNFHTILIST